MTRPSLVILVPAYNEEGRITPTLVKYATYFREHYQGEFKILVVLNGCRDRTLDVVQGVARDFPEITWTVIEAPVGKGGALIEGLRLAPDAELIGYTDADGSTDAASFFQLAERCRSTDCVIGSRRVTGSVIHQLQPSQRLLASRVFHIIVELLFGMRIQDTQCGAKVMRMAAVRQIHSTLNIADMAFDINLLYSLKRAGFRIVEAPVAWTDHLGSTVRYFRTSLVMFLSIVRVRIIYSPFYFVLKLLRPLETMVYRALRNPPPRPPSKPEIDRADAVRRAAAIR